MRHKKIGRRIMLFLLLLLTVAMLSACQSDDTEEVLMTLDGEEVFRKEGLLYALLTIQEFEDIGGEEVWSMTLSGRDAESVAYENALESLIQTKVMASEYDDTLHEADQLLIERTMSELKEAIGEDMLETLDIADRDLSGYVEDSYRAFQYTESMVFLPGDMESELDTQVAEAYIAYEGYDQETYLQKVQMSWIMIYTGEWVDDEFVSYPETQQEEKYTMMVQAYEAVVEGSDFELVREVYSEDTDDADCPLLTEGIIQCREDGVFYRGQMMEDVANEIFLTPAGTYSDVIETSYGYLLAWVEDFEEPDSEDYVWYETQLEEEKLIYRSELEEALSEELLEEEYERLLDDVQIEIHDEVWNEICQTIQDTQ